MVQMIKKPNFCNEVLSVEQHTTFRNLLAKYDRFCCFQSRYEKSPNSVRAFYMTDTDGNPFIAAALYGHNPWERTINLSCINCGQNINDCIPIVQWITGVAILEMEVDKVGALVADDSVEYAFMYFAAGYSHDGFLRDHLLLPDGRRSDAYFVSILKHEFERQHLLHCDATSI